MTWHPAWTVSPLFSCDDIILPAPQDRPIWLLLDVDDTLITPVDDLFRRGREGADPYFIDDLKANAEAVFARHGVTNGDLQRALGVFRSTRQIRLTEPRWPIFLEHVRHERPDISIFALTKMAVGPCPPISDLAQWRFNELSSLGLTFLDLWGTPQPLQNKGQVIGGIMMTGSLSKDAALMAFADILGKKPGHMIFVDDHLCYLRDVQKVAVEWEVPYDAYHYRGVERILGNPDPHIIELQKKTLLREYKWLSDQEAENRLRKESSKSISSF